MKLQVKGQKPKAHTNRPTRLTEGIEIYMVMDQAIHWHKATDQMEYQSKQCAYQACLPVITTNLLW